jgi:hypothetical protein
VGPFNPGNRSDTGVTGTIEELWTWKIETAIVMERPAWLGSIPICFTANTGKLVVVLSCCNNSSPVSTLRLAPPSGRDRGQGCGIRRKPTGFGSLQ